MLCGEIEEKLLDEALKDSEFQLILNANPVSRARVEAGDGPAPVTPRRLFSLASIVLEA